MFYITLLVEPKSITQSFTLLYIVVHLYGIFLSYIQKIVSSAIENTILFFIFLFLSVSLLTNANPTETLISLCQQRFSWFLQGFCKLLIEHGFYNIIHAAEILGGAFGNDLFYHT